MEFVPKKITVDTIVNKEFNSEMDGFNKAEVNAFLDEICDFLEYQEKTQNTAPVSPAANFDSAEIAKRDAEIARLQGLVKQAQRESAEARAKLELAPKSEVQLASEQATNLLVNAQKVYDKTVSDANQRANEIINNAQAEADKQIAGLSAQREQLQADVTDLQNRFAAHLQKVENLVEEQRAQIAVLKERSL